MEYIRKTGLRLEGIRVLGKVVWSGVCFKYTGELEHFTKTEILNYVSNKTKEIWSILRTFTHIPYTK